ncbi:VWA domain-containing protein [Marinomonas hwangdonensis]|uniref:VWA domain-containing protein n=1 Tax=Marinomonas hwangdonensis TaxID=1053647 RepID=A0A3M8Q4R8_9GAMM|nr:VWA domain-containing protein [Marinomonas hwangdonensis]RNF51109.1 VWA domain-containing protein [Marinomonas hwangdonensis]
MKWLKINTVLLLSVLVFSMAPLTQASTQFRIIVDASGSMLISDPDKLTPEALRLISQLAPEDESTLGVWLFGEAPRVLFPEAKVNTETKAKLANFLRNYTTEDVQTDLEAIIRMLLDTPDLGDLSTDFNRHWILVTDGMVDISLDEAVNDASRERILNELTTQLVERNVHLHTISIAGHTDKELLQSIALQTNATHTEVAFPDDLLDTFDRIFTQASPSEELPINGNQFSVDAAIEELTLLMFHEEARQPRILMPNGDILPLQSNDKVALSVSDHYTLITIQDPAQGLWSLRDVDLERSSVRVMTNLSARMSVLSSIVFEGEPIRSVANLFEQENKITDNAILDLVTIKQTLIHNNGDIRNTLFSGDMVHFQDQFEQEYEGISEPGLYELTSVVDGKTFSRQIVQQFTVHPAIDFIGVPVGNDTIRFSAKPVNLKLNLFASSITLLFSYPDGTSESILMPLIGQGYWEKALSVDAGRYVKVKARLIGVTQFGRRFEYETPEWVVGRDAGKAPIAIRSDRLTKEALFASNIASLTTASDTDSTAPMLVAPSITLVDDTMRDIVPADNNTSISAEAEVRNTDANNNAESILSSKDWILYVLLNVGGIFIIGGGILLYRRIKKNTPT